MRDLDIPDDVVAWVGRLHAAVDGLVSPISARHPGLRCAAGCASCCQDGLTVFSIEAARIVHHHRELLERGTPRREGGCAFLDDHDRCRIYEDRPYVCRTQGLPLRWLEKDAAGEFEARDVCALNADAVALEELPPESLWTIGPVESRLAQKQDEVDGGRGTRIALRDLFAASRPANDAKGPETRRHLPLVKP